MKKLNTDIDLDDEIRCLVQYVRQKWSPVPHLNGIFFEVLEKARKVSQGCIQGRKLTQALQRRLRARINIISLAHPTLDIRLIRRYDSICHVLSALLLLEDKFVEAGQCVEMDWDHYTLVRSLTSRLISTYTGLDQIKPLGWDDLARDYVEFDGQENYDPKSDEALFEGADVHGPVTPNFVNRIALPFVLYEDRCHGQCPAFTLIEGVFSQLLGILEYQNTQALVEAVERLYPAAKDPDMLFEMDVPSSDNPFLKAMLRFVPPTPTRLQFDQVTIQAKKPDLEEDARLQGKGRDRYKQIREQFVNPDLAEAALEQIERETECKILLQWELARTRQKITRPIRIGDQVQLHKSIPDYTHGEGATWWAVAGDVLVVKEILRYIDSIKAERIGRPGATIISDTEFRLVHLD